MRVYFVYYMADGALVGLPLDVDERRPFGAVIEDAHEIATESFGPCSFRTVTLPRHMVWGPRPISEIIAPIEATVFRNMENNRP